jgi:hypothetical protein
MSAAKSVLIATTMIPAKNIMPPPLAIERSIAKIVAQRQMQRPTKAMLLFGVLFEDSAGLTLDFVFSTILPLKVVLKIPLLKAFLFARL